MCRASVIPERGALVSELIIGDRSILYLDRDNLDDSSKNVRGGIPLLFPVAGKLVNDRYLATNSIMQQHGFGRRKPWAVADFNEFEIRMTLRPDSETRAEFPFDFRAEQTVTVIQNGIHISLLVANDGNNTITVSPGWHPYFACKRSLKNGVRCDIETVAKDALGTANGFDFGRPAPQDGRVKTHVPGIGDIQLSFSPEMRHMQFWSLPEQDFVCIEPYWGPPNAANTVARCGILPGCCRSFWLRVQCAV